MSKKKNQEQKIKAAIEKGKQQGPRPTQPLQNGIRRPRPGTATGRVWEIADQLSAEQGSPASRSDVLKVYEAEGGNHATGTTQYGRWRKFHGLPGRAVAPKQDEPEVEVEDEDLEADEPELEDDDDLDEDEWDEDDDLEEDLDDDDEDE